MRSCFVLAFFIVAVPFAIRAQEPDMGAKDENYHAVRYVFATRPVPMWDFRNSIGGSITLLPQPLTEYPVPAPAVELRSRLGLPLNVMAYGRAASNIVTSFVQAGLSWSHMIENFSFGVGWSAAYVYGNLTFVDGFNTSQHRWMNYPMITGTGKFNDVVLTVRVEAELMTSLTKRIATQTIVTQNDVYTGSSLTIAVEQPFWRNTQVLFGATFSLSSNPYQAWFIYNTFQDRLLSTEFFMGFVL